MGLDARSRPRAGRALLVCLAFVATACASSPERVRDIARSWDKALVALPGRSLSVGPGSVSATAPMPSVVHLHGCSGIIGDEVAWARHLGRAGYAVIMPDSFARAGRKRDCDPSRARGGLFPRVWEMREEEIGHALAQVRTLPWVDARNVFLMGHSEGGAAVALWGGGGVNAQVILGWWCRYDGTPALDGIRMPRSMPVLAVTFQVDGWFSPYYRESACGRVLRGHRAGEEIVLSGGGHEVSGSPRGIEAVVAFLRRHTVP